MRPTHAELLETARQVLSGEMTYTQLREQDRYRQAYTFVALMLVCREDYMDGLTLRPRRPLNHTMASFWHDGYSQGEPTLVTKSRELDLHRSTPGSVRLTPPDELSGLVAGFSPESPGVMAFFRDLKAARAAYLEECNRLSEQEKAERAVLMPIEAAGDALLEKFFAGEEDSKIFAERILWELYGPAARNAAAMMAEATPDVRAYVAARLVRVANRY